MMNTDNDKTQQMSKIEFGDTEETSQGFFREATLDLLFYVLMVAVCGSVIIAIGYLLIEYAWPFLQRAFTNPVETGIVMVAVGAISFYAGAYLKRRRM